MADHYRNLAHALVSLGFLFRRQDDRYREVWRNRQTDQEVTFDRDEVSKSRAAADAVLAEAQTGKASGKPEVAAAARTAPRKSALATKPAAKPADKPSAKSVPKPATKPPRTRATVRKHTGRPARPKTKR